MRREIDTLERNYADLESQRKRDLESLKDELKQSNQLTTRLQRERDEATAREEAAQIKLKDLMKLLGDKQAQFDSLQRDFVKS